MLKRVLLKSVVAAAAVLFTGTVAKADFVIDNFVTPNPAVSYSLGGAVGAIYPQTDILASGITRNLVVTQTENIFGDAGNTTGKIGTTVVGGRFIMSTAAGATAWASLLYTYGSAQNLSVGGTSVLFTFASADLNTPFTVKISDGSLTKIQIGVVSSTSLGTLAIALSGFAAEGLDTSHVTSIELQINRNDTTGDSTPQADVTLSDVRVTTPAPPAAVPAPPAVLLLLAAAPVMGLVRYTRRKVTA